MTDIKVVDGWSVVTAPKCTLVMTKADFLKCWRQGKWWRRRQALVARSPTVGLR